MASPSTPNGIFSNPFIDSPVDEDLWGAILNSNFNIADGNYTTRTFDLDFAGFELAEAEVVDFSEKTFDLGTTSGALVVDYTNGHYQRLIVDGDITSVTINNWPVSGQTGFMSIEFTQDGVGSQGIDLTGGTYFATDGNMVLNGTPNEYDVLRFESRDAGTRVSVAINARMQVIT